ncbi:gliding motility-associated-like protein [Chitinophaga dinghuensis]|uniref:Gliding motility-associated-like protein n=1 Tax=Chitinophaga dinghuensis TaxID=1539050 RepID=A0A327WKF7_9BACT|nr:MBG domain-containing protein [Chitinophaga dinghuensis]RAJ88274.1 gliding motility-associated-like protein [Chitinophaga dinghuensis]
MKKFIYVSLVCAFALLSATTQAQDAQGILYVKSGGAGTGSGDSWNNAIAELADALRTATALNTVTAGTVKQIWVAAGTYKPQYPATAVTTGTATNTDRNNSFVLVPDVKVYGGFAGYETDITGRNFITNTTILSGDIGTPGINTDNAYRVVVAAGEMGDALISGFTISGAYCEITGSNVINGVNSSLEYGGGITVRSAALLIEDVILTNNYSKYGAGAACYSASGDARANAIFRRVSVLKNVASGGGGGIYATYADVEIENATGSFNTTSGTNNGGMFSFAQSAIVSCRLSSVNENRATSNGGAVFCNGNAVATFYKCNFIKDTAASGAVFTTNGAANILFENCSMKGCIATTLGSGGYINGSSSNVTLVNTQVTGNYSSNGTDYGTIRIGGGALKLINSTISGNNKSAVFVFSGNLNVINSIIYDNNGGIINSYNASYSVIQGAAENTATHVTPNNPLFVNSPAFTSAPFTGGDYSLQATSPCVHAGNDNLYHANDTVTVDLAGNDRFMGPAIDLGAFERLLASQTITALPDTAVVYGDVFTRAFAASSGLTVSLSSSDASIASVFQDAADGNTWKIKANKAGVVNITMSQEGDATFAKAPPVVFVLTVNKASLTVTAKDATKTYDGLAFSRGNGLTYTGFVADDDNNNALTGTITYTGTSQSAVNAGTYVITPGGLAAVNYDISYVSGALSITKADLTITAKDATKTYDGLAFSSGNGISYSGFVTGDDNNNALTGTITYSGTSQSAVNVGQYVITPGGLSAVNYDISYVSGTLSITKADLTITAIGATKTYDGLAFSGGNGVTYSGFVAGDDNNNALTGTITFTGTSQSAVNVGTYVITPGGLSAVNYDINYVSDALSITKADLTITAIGATKTYDGTAFSGGNGISYSGFVAGDDNNNALTGTLTYSGTSQSAVNAGQYVITPGGLSAVNYDISYVSGTLSITKADLTITAKDATKTYDGIAFSSGNGISYSGFVTGDDNNNALTGTLTYTGTSQSAVNVGTYVITPGGLAAVNYDISYVSGALSITKADLTITAKSTTKTYDGLAFIGGNGITYSGFVTGDDNNNALTGTITYTGTSQSAVNVGTYVITPGGLSAVNYDINYVNGALSIIKADLTITAIGATKTYDGIAFSGGNGITYSGFVTGDDNNNALTGTLTYTGTSQSAVSVGTYVITPGGLSAVNYDINYVSDALSITKADLTITAIGATKTYDGTAFSGGNGISYSGFVAGDDNNNALTGTLTYSGTSQSAVNAGLYVITPGGLSAVNYDISYVSGTLSITKAGLTITAIDATKTYDGLAFNGGNGITYSGFVAGDDNNNALTGAVTYTGTSQSAVNVGTYVITPGGLAAVNYDISYVSGTLSITKASLTITATDATKTYDGLAFSGGNGVTYSGFVNNENKSVLNGTLAYSGAAQGAVDAGVYVITVSGATSDNYAINYLDGQLTVNKAPLTITANNITKTYDGVAFTGGNGVTYTGLVNNEQPTILGGTLTYTGNSQNATHVNTYIIIPGGVTADNYSISFVDGVLNIQPATVIVTANDALRCYGLPNPAFHISYNGWVNNETMTVLTAQPTATSTATIQSSAGDYAIVPSGATADDYVFTYVNGHLTIPSPPASSLSASEGLILCDTDDSRLLLASGNYSFNWYLNNSIIPDGINPTLTATVVGTYTAKATDGYGCSAMATNNLVVTQVVPPKAAFSFNGYCKDVAVVLANTSQINNAGTVNYTWDSGDGQTSTTAEPQFIYSTTGTYNVQLKVSMEECPNLTSTIVHPITIEAAQPGKKLAAIYASAGIPQKITGRNFTTAGYAWTPSTGLNTTTVYNPMATINNSETYQIAMTFPSGCVTTDTLAVNVVIGSEIFVANAFTPNGDGRNDILNVKLRDIIKFNYLRIFTRWGSKVFETRDATQGWNGYFNHELQPLGTYLWIAEGVDKDGRVIHREGAVTLLR